MPRSTPRQVLFVSCLLAAFAAPAAAQADHAGDRSRRSGHERVMPCGGALACARRACGCLHVAACRPDACHRERSSCTAFGCDDDALRGPSGWCCRCDAGWLHPRSSCDERANRAVSLARARVEAAERELNLARRAVWRALDRARFTGARADRERHARALSRVPMAEEQLADMQAALAAAIARRDEGGGCRDPRCPCPAR